MKHPAFGDKKYSARVNPDRAVRKLSGCPSCRLALIVETLSGYFRRYGRRCFSSQMNRNQCYVSHIHIRFRGQTVLFGDLDWLPVASALTLAGADGCKKRRTLFRRYTGTPHSMALARIFMKLVKYFAVVASGLASFFFACSTKPVQNIPLPSKVIGSSAIFVFTQGRYYPSCACILPLWACR